MKNANKSLLLIAITVLFIFTACKPPKILFSVSEGKAIAGDSKLVLVKRGNKELPAKKNLKLKKGDVIQMESSVSGVGFRSFNTISTAHGPATIVVDKGHLEQKDGVVLHDAKSGTLLIPEMSIIHNGASYLVAIEEKTIEIVVFSGEILVSSNLATPPWKPFSVEKGYRRKIWRDGKLAPNQPLSPDDLNQWIETENQLLIAGGSDSRMVPYVLTLPSEDAKGLIKSIAFPVNLKYTEVGESNDELGTITVQQPSGGRRVKKNSTVSIFERSRRAIVPNVFGLSLGKAESILRNAGLNGKMVKETITEKTEPSLVNGQKPAPEEAVAEGSIVELTIEAVAVAVPNLLNLSVSNASKNLGTLQLKKERTDYVIGFTGDPVVVSQKPLPGTLVFQNSEIMVVLKAPGYAVPNVVGLSEMKANELISNAGFSIGNNKEKQSTEIKKGIVISQTPTGGTSSGRDVPVVLTISKGSE